MFTKYNATNCSMKLQDSLENVQFWLWCDYDRWLNALLAIKEQCHGVWAELVIKKLAPPTWARLCAMGQKLVHTFMEKEFLLFRLNTHGWKLSLLCTTNYPNWHKSHINNESNWKMDNKKVIKHEVAGSHDDIDSNINDLEAKPLVISKGKKCACDTDDTKATHKHVKESGSLHGDSDITASLSSTTSIIKLLSHSSASAAGSFDITASLSSSISIIKSLSYSSATATGSLDGNSSALSQICKTVLLDKTFLPPPPPPHPSPSPPHGVYLPQPISCMNHSQAEKENILIFLKNPLADVSGGVNGIPKWIPSPALCDPNTAVKSVLWKKSKASNWQKNINKKGTTQQFRLYWGALSTAQQDEYQAEAEHLNSAGSWKKLSDSVVINGILY
ncbi:uncharacterized protein BJ212DRAFT_1304680 [Suillus subaureus]|uniref:Uncharacterized protein n=1 Tax=Suillus subaureus TaxID=48587 RepID=A0A9P7DUB0_9AGAM|nr:uncharacterized protein BJ212DRAFT_1304680 [Suillus subaureus]KAG1803115.1 hypothetical protein BJ212DRAFT_1304680 [Suillus subaureus]